MVTRKYTLHKKAGKLAHEAVLIGAGVVFFGALAVAYVTDTAQQSRGALAPVVVRPQITAANGPTLLPDSYGMAFGDTLRTLPQAELDAQLADVASLGFKWVRIDIDWSAVQPKNANDFDWRAYDRVVDAANAHNLQVLATIAYAPAWARMQECTDDSKCAPATPAVYAAFAQEAAKRYGPQGVKSWEIWNEPNVGFWKPMPDASLYTKYLKAAYAAIKAADPSATVISAGLAPAEDTNTTIPPRNFLSGMYAAGAKGSFDAVGYHPYSYPAPPDVAYSWSGWSQMADLATSLRSIMVAHGDGNKLIWITEIGAPTGGTTATATPANFRSQLTADHVDEQLQTAFADQAVQALNGSPWAGPAFWYSYKDLGGSRQDKANENYFGIIRADGSHKPAYNAFKKLLGK